MKTTDGGDTWKDIELPQPAVFFPSDFYFRDSLNGWISTSGDATLQSGCYRTTDGGETWSFLTGSGSDARGIYYNEKTHGLFIASWHPGFGLQSFDNGSTWSRLPPGLSNGFAFNDSLNGINFGVSGNAGGGPHPTQCMRTTDGGLSWNVINFDSECWQPIAIAGTKTQFALTDHYGALFKTNDLWETWSNPYTFSSEIVDTAPRWNTVGSGCIRGDLAHLFVQMQSGAYISSDEGNHWKYLCGMPSRVTGDRRFYVKYPYLYISTSLAPETDFQGYIWMLNLDSLYNYQSAFTERLSNNQTHISPFGGDTVLITYSNNRSVDTAIAVDSVVITVRYDSNNTMPIKYASANGWKISSLSNDTGFIRVVLLDTAHEGAPLLSISYQTYLSSSSTKIYLDSVRSYGHRIFCDCDVTSFSGADSVELNFQYHCGDSVLAEYLRTGNVPFSIESVVPNPAREELSVRVRQQVNGAVRYELIDGLGRVVLNGEFFSTPPALTPTLGLAPVVATFAPQGPRGEGEDFRLNVGALPSGVYNLRVSQGGFVQARRVVIER